MLHHRLGRALALACVVALLAATPASAWTPKSVKSDPLVFMPGTQPSTVAGFEGIGRCENCHSGYNEAVEPGRNWRGSMMAQAARDPLWLACLTVSAQDSIWALGNPNATDICIRCHSPQGWLEGASDPTNTSKLSGGQLDGVHCDFCHRKIDPFAEFRQPDVPADSGTAATLAQTTYNTNITDLKAIRLFDGSPFLSITNLLPTWYAPFPTGYSETGAGQYFVSSAGGPKYGPRWDSDARHQWNYSRYHKSREFCHACHDVSNPILENVLADDSGSSKFAAATYFHVERTSSEFLLSAYGSGSGAPTDILGVPKADKCQDCHMRDVPGTAANKAGLQVRPDLATHDLTGGNVWLTKILASADPNFSGYDAYNYSILSGQKYAGASIHVAGLSGQGANLDRGAKRAMDQLKMAATLSEVANSDPSKLTIRVKNNTGHKLISGFPEGRRMFLNLKFYDATGTAIGQINEYKPLKKTGGGAFDGGAEIDPASKDGKLIWEAEMSSSLTDEDKTFHFALADGRYKDNRIPPKGFDKSKAAERKADPVWGGVSNLSYFSDEEYAGGWDDVTVTKPAGTASYSATLYYQTTSKEYIKFLRDEAQGYTAPDAGAPTLTGKGVAGDPAYLIQTDASGFFNNLKGWGSAIWDLWVHNGGAAPIEMATLGQGPPQPDTGLTVGVPTNVRASYSTKQKAVTVSWVAPSTGANGYYVYRGTAPGVYNTEFKVAGGATSYADKAVSGATTYYYAVKAYKVDKLGTEYLSDRSNEATIRIK